MKYCIGIDTGVRTGVAVWHPESREFVSVSTMTLTRALDMVRGLAADGVKVYFEDARQRRWIPDTHDLRREMGRRQGAGSVKRDCRIWEDFCRENRIPFEAVAPRRNRTKLSAEAFRRLTGWQGRTSQHARDAAMLVFGKGKELDL